MNKLENLIPVDCEATWEMPYLEMRKCRHSSKITGKADMVELQDSKKKKGEEDETMRDLVMMAMDLLNNITLGLNHGDFAEKFIPFQRTNPSSTCEIWMWLTLVF